MSCVRPAHKLCNLLGSKRFAHPRSVSSLSPQATMATPSRDVAAIESLLPAIVPQLSGHNYKGRHGKVGVVGGCMEYTGAPYFAAISAMKTGADLGYVFCTASAGPVIKSYSPELIVMPCLPEEGHEMHGDEREAAVQRAVEGVDKWLQRLSCLVVGPGLGDDGMVVEATKRIITKARSRNLPLVVDGSGLNIVAQEPDLVRGYSLCVLTPNMAELGRLAGAVGVEVKGACGSHWQQEAGAVAAGFQGPVLVSKGPSDIIISGGREVRCEVEATPRRCGGQGDVLAGCMAVMVSWAMQHAESAATVNTSSSTGGSAGVGIEGIGGLPPPLLVAAYGGCLLTRTASSRAFAREGRSMLAGDIIGEIKEAFKSRFEA